ncbi:signal peptidase I [Bifidobacterium commune]|uniref:Signal peptidase I n=1 Tax=Bifidobacterium commune TaxID=1505727 RepID=A0A1C4GZ94_9BIFI|nr:signal peptidase I [Bifidobacterium commune]MBB2955481.1 signal peptidase I [Bifidobacterium commune]SCC77939.1 signal peptidase I [Bifidobacterium commune]
MASEEVRRSTQTGKGLSYRAKHAKRNGSSSSADREMVHYAVEFVALLLVLVLLRMFAIGVYVIPSSSMEDTIAIGDRLITNRLAGPLKTVKRGDVVVFSDPARWLVGKQSHGSDDLIKRVIGMPGDMVECKGGGAPVTVNGVAIDESVYLKPGVEPSIFPFSVKVTAGNVFVMGDNRANSADSRYHADDGNGGLVPMKNIIGVAMLTFWPFAHFRTMNSHHEVFESVPDAPKK